jgi:hypothetical protein
VLDGAERRCSNSRDESGFGEGGATGEPDAGAGRREGVMLRNVVLALAGMFAGTLSGGAAEVKEDKGDSQAKEAVAQYIKAMKDKDLDGLLKVADVPFCENGRRVIREREALKKMYQTVLKEKEFSKAKVKVKMVTTLPKLEELSKDKFSEKERKNLGEVLGKDHRVVLIEIERPDGKKGQALLGVRLRDGKAKVVAALG